MRLAFQQATMVTCPRASSAERGHVGALALSTDAAFLDIPTVTPIAYDGSDEGKSELGAPLGQYFTVQADGADAGVVFGPDRGYVLGAFTPDLSTVGSVDGDGVYSPMPGEVYRIPSGTSVSFLLNANTQIRLMGFVGSGDGVLRFYQSSRAPTFVPYQGEETEVDTIILFDPSQSSAGNRVQTWGEVMAKVSASEAPITIIPISPRNAPIDVPLGTWDMRYARIASLQVANWSGILNLPDGAVLHNLGMLTDGGFIIGNPTAAPCLTFDGNPSDHDSQYFSVQNNAVLQNNGSYVMWQVPGPAPVGGRIDINDNGSLIVGGAAPVIGIASGGTLAVNLSEVGVGLISDNFVVGDDTTEVVLVTDATDAVPNISGTFLGELLVIATPGLAAPTAGRPTPNQAGVSIFDSTLGKPIWWTGAAWVDATGAPV